MLLAVVGVSVRSFAQTPQNGRAFARLAVPKHTLYVGESVPITIQAYYVAGMGVTITGSPTANTADFTMKVGEGAQGRATIGSDAYTVVTWRGHVSPTKAGKYPLRITIPSTLEWQDVRRDAPSDTNDAFGDPFGDLSDAFGRDDRGGDPFAAMQQRMQRMMQRAYQDLQVGPVQKKDVVLESPRAELSVLALPSVGRPAAFSGAVGHFDLSANVDAATVRAGEPVELRVVVGGTGNFDRVSTPGVPNSKELKTYAPTATAKDDAKTFAQAVVPQRAGALEIPPVPFSYFDPDAARYVTLQSAAIALDVKPGQALAATSDGALPDATTRPTLAANADLDGKAVASLRPMIDHEKFWLVQLVPFGMLAAAASFIARRRRVAADPHHVLRRGASRALRRHRTAMKRAFAARDATAFFTAARGALQQRLGAMWGITPEAITLVEIERRVKGPQLETLRTVFEADAARFGVGAAAEDLSRWNSAVLSVLAKPEAS
jgi:hypothetical protein